jgi:hypothetical protein
MAVHTLALPLRRGKIDADIGTSANAKQIHISKSDQNLNF